MSAEISRGTFLCFVKPFAMVGKSVDQVQYSITYNQKTDTELIIGEAVRDFIKQKQENHLMDSRINDFYQGVTAYIVLC